MGKHRGCILNWHSTQQKLEALVKLNALEGLSWEHYLQLAESFELRDFKAGDELEELVFVWVEGQPLASYPEGRIHRAPAGQTVPLSCKLLCLEPKEFCALLLRIPQLAVGLWEQAS